METAAKKMVTVEVVAEQMFYSVTHEDGTATTRQYVRGDVFEMEEQYALEAAKGEIAGSPTVQKNGAGTEVFVYPPKTPGAGRAAVRILGEKPAKVSTPIFQETFKPAPEPEPAGKRK